MRIRTLLLATLFALALGARPIAARAQQPAVGPRPTQPLDAVVMVQPEGDRAEVSVAYARTLPAQDVKQTLERLARLGGWRMSDVAVRDEAPVAGAKPQTSASATITGKSLVAPGGFRLQPFVDAFSSLDRFELIYFVAPQPWFHGLAHFESPVVTVSLTSAEGPYRYEVAVHDHLAAVPKLPITQAAAGSAPAPVRVTPASAPWPVWQLIALAAACGLAVYVALRLLAIRSARLAQATERRAAPADRRAGRTGNL